MIEAHTEIEEADKDYSRREWGMYRTGSSYLRFDQDEIDEEHDKVMLDVFIGKAFASRTLRQSYAFA